MRVEQVAAKFDVEGSVIRATAHGRGHIHDSYRVEAEHDRATNRYFLQRINTEVFPDPTALMANIHRVTDHLRTKLSAKGRRAVREPTLTIVSSCDGSLMYVDPEGGHWRMYRMIEHATTHEDVRSPLLAEQAGRCFGTFQRMLADLPHPRLHETIPRFHDTPNRFTALDRVIRADAAGRVRAAAAEIDFARRQRPNAGQLVDSSRAGQLPERVVHNDAKIDNVLFDDATGEPICVVDLDTVMPGLALWDFGDMVRTMTTAQPEDSTDLNSIEVDLALFEALVRGYLKGTGSMLTTEERERMVLAARVITLEQGVRFLTDYLNGDRYYKTSRPDHNLQRCRSQFALLDSMARQEDAMDRVVAGC